MAANLLKIHTKTIRTPNPAIPVSLSKTLSFTFLPFPTHHQHSQISLPSTLPNKSKIPTLSPLCSLSSPSPPNSKEAAIQQAKTCLTTALEKPLNNLRLSNKLKKLKQPRFRIEIPVADDSPESLSQLAFQVFGDLPIKRKGSPVCIFAYGQTGSGKTYTMMGKPGNPEQKGLIPRTLEQIFKTRQFVQPQGWKYEMQVSMLEIYNETIRDLLATNKSSLDMLKTENGTAGKQYTIKHDANGNTHVSDLTIVDVRSASEVSFLLERAAHSRSVGKTQMNEQSSRSHFVFTLRIYGVNESTEQQVQGILNLIDLAGSERLSKSGSTGDRLRETQAINKSLSSLSDVIFALAKKEDHVPFRNSKLTYLLQPCLGGDSKTLMFVNIAPDSSSAGESLCSLRFAARVNACEIGVPRRQTYTRPSDSRLSYG